MAVRLDLSVGELQVDTPRELFRTRFPYPPYHSFDVSGDGQRFRVNTLVVSPAAPRRVAMR